LKPIHHSPKVTNATPLITKKIEQRTGRIN